MRAFLALFFLLGGIMSCAYQPGSPQVSVLSAGAVEPGLAAAIALFEKDTGAKVAVTYNTAPQIRERIEKKGEKFDLVVLPPAAMEALAKDGRIAAERVTLGSVGQGIAVRPDAPLPDISSVNAMKRALIEADSVVFNRATGGQYIESMLKRIGVYGDIERKTTRYASAAEVMEHLLKGKGREIGFAPITEIMQYTKKGLRFVGPLPQAVQQRNTYVASLMTGASSGEGAARLLRFLATPAAKSALVSGGVD